MLKIFQTANVARIALVMNLIGSVLLAFSFSATSSAFRLIKLKIDNATVYEICGDDLALSKADTRGNIIIDLDHCMDPGNTRPVAIVVADYPNLLWVGFGFMIVGFLLQFLAIQKGGNLLQKNP